jgi:hypothetical protein
MTYLDIIRQAVRTYIINLVAGTVVTDIATNGLSVDDQAIVDAFLAQTAP